MEPARGMRYKFDDHIEMAVPHPRGVWKPDTREGYH